MAKEKHNEDGVRPSSSSRYISAGGFAVVAAVIYCLQVFPYRAVLSYREQLQLFQTTGSYFRSLVDRPGGPATYVGEFLTQFFNNFQTGAAVVTVLLLSFLSASYHINNRFAPSAPKTTNLAFSLMPLISLWLYWGNQDVTLCFMIAMLSALAGACLFISIGSGRVSAKGNIKKYTLMIAGTTLLYWLAGPATLVFTLLVVAFDFRNRQDSIANKGIFALVAFTCIAANVWIWSLFLPYPVSYQLIGIGYMMTPDRLDAGQIAVEALCVLVPVMAALTARMPRKVMLPSLIAVEAAAIVILYPRAYDRATYRLIDYDHMVRTNDWNGILSYSDAHDPDLPLSVSATNLAAGMTGQLDACAFDYFQNGPEGLLPPFVKETLSSWTTGEIFFQLGMTNSAQRFYFEGMEAIPNYNKSSRAVKRLAETAIVRGEYALAEKYLKMLENTIFYKKWAQRNLALIKDPREVEKNPQYATLRGRMIDEEYLFSEGELDKTLGQLFLKDPGNDLARQYLIVYPLLERDLNKFAQYMGVVAEAHPKYNPLLAQQALAFISMKNGQPIPREIVSPMVEQSLRSFAQAWVSKDPSRIEPHRRTLYHYLLSDDRRPTADGR